MIGPGLTLIYLPSANMNPMTGAKLDHRSTGRRDIYHASVKSGSEMRMIVRRSDIQANSFDGLSIADHTAGLAGSSSVATIEVPASAGHRLAWSRRSDKYYLVLAGMVRFTLDGADHDLAAGDLCLVRQGRQFRYCNPAAESARLLLVHTPPFALEDDVFADDSAIAGDASDR